MPRIQWTGLPPALRDHLFDRLRERKITADDLYQLKTWRESDPDAPDGLWYKDFGSFKICGEGKFPKTFLLAASLCTPSRSHWMVASIAPNFTGTGTRWWRMPCILM
jgi:hypothetical protein